jgi:hypothetical protein
LWNDSQWHAVRIQPERKILSRFLPTSIDVKMAGELGVHICFGEANDFQREFDKELTALPHEIVNRPLADIQ